MTTYGLQAGPFYVMGRNAAGLPELTPTPHLAKTFTTPQEAAAFGEGLELPAGTGISREVWMSMQVVTGKCVIRREGKYLSATGDEVVWVDDLHHAREFGTADAAQAFIRRRTGTVRARHSDDGTALQGATVEITFA